MEAIADAPLLCFITVLTGCLVITDPEDPKFDLEAFLKLKAGEA